ncbi:MAG: HAD hydrolase-like protein [Clostridia bacterium]|nr:HAD hydrolase-like protein [Clostridia bacterium]
MRPTHVLWDFNGTVLDDLQPCIKSINTLLVRYGLKPVPDVETYRNIFGFPIKDYYERLGFDFSKLDFSVLAVEWVDLYNEYNHPLRLCPGIKDALEAVKDANIRQLILTASSCDMVKEQLSELGIGDYFEEIIGLDNIHAHGKTEVARDWINRTSPGCAVLIGDTPHDSEVADDIGIDCLLVCCGHSPRKSLEKLRPTFTDPYEAVKSLL